MKPGQMVAFILNAQVHFGVLAAIIRRESTEGEKTQWVVTSVGPDSIANSDVTIEDEDDLGDMEAWNKEDKILVLAARTAPFKWAKKKSHEADEPVAPPPADLIVVSDAVPVESPKKEEDIPF